MRDEGVFMRKTITVLRIIAIAAVIMCVVPACKDDDGQSGNNTGGNIDPTVIAAPTADPPPSSYDQGQNLSVTLSTTTPNVNIFYTLDGTTPSANSTKYTDPIPISSSTFLKARAVKTGVASSSVLIAEYWFREPAVYPNGYPKTQEMSNPLFWQFPSPKVDGSGSAANAAGNLYTADPSARVWNINGTDTLFVYASHDMEEADERARMDRYHVFSTTDMRTWTDYGEIFNAAGVPWNVGPFRNGSTYMWAPDCVNKNGKYYFYFPHPDKNADNDSGSWGRNWRIGIAVSDHPASNFVILPQPLAGIPVGRNDEYDPAVFIDDDGQAYFYYGGNGRAYGGKLKDSMTEIDGEFRRMEGLNDFRGGIWVHKYNGNYYLSYADNGGGGENNGDQIKYAMSGSPLGPWESKGVCVYSAGNGTIQGSIVEFNGQWYAFYHSDLVSHNGDKGRSIHADKLYYNSDGSIKPVNTWGEAYNGPHNVTAVTGTSAIALTLQAEDFNDGGETYGYHDTDSYNNPPRFYNNYRTSSVNIENGSNGKIIAGIQNREFLRYTINVAKAGLYDVDVYVSSVNGNGKFYLNVDGVNKSGTKTVQNTGNLNNYQKVTAAKIPLKAGENLFEIRVQNGGFNLDKFEFRNAAPYTGTPYRNPNTNKVPGKIEAEDFDRGGQNVAYDDHMGRQDGFAEYRTDNPSNHNDKVVDIELYGENCYHISFTDNGEWIKYTLDVTQAGTYDVIVRAASGNGNGGSFWLTFDDAYTYPPLHAATSAWSIFTTITTKGVTLTAGTHIMTVTMGGNINIDWYEFVKK